MKVRLVVDPLEGPAVRVFDVAAPFKKSRVFRRADCRQLGFSLKSTGWRINHIRDYRVSLELDCGGGELPTLVGQASSSHCH